MKYFVILCWCLNIFFACEPVNIDHLQNNATDTQSSKCGNGRLDDDETCDGTLLNGQTCATRAATVGELRCQTDCSGFNLSKCAAPESCGDGQIQEHEVCDKSSLGAASCKTQGYNDGLLICHNNCLGFDTSFCGAKLAECNNHIREGNEVCDLEDLGPKKTCADLGLGAGELSCNDSCTDYVTTKCTETPKCPNGKIEKGEACDSDTKTCSELGLKGDSKVGCKEDCSGYDYELICTSQPLCGNQIKEAGEECDTKDFGNKTCQDLGFSRGELLCTLNNTQNPCTVDRSSCCSPQCTGKSCGASDDCGGYCTSAPQCPGECSIETAQCSSPTSFHVCGNDLGSLQGNTYGPEISCRNDEVCQGGACQCPEGTRCRCSAAEIMFLVDRSARITSQAWSWLTEAFLGKLAERESANYFGLRQFPMDKGCDVAPPLALALNNKSPIAKELKAPTVDNAMPIARALANLAPQFGVVTPGQAVVLISTFDDLTCGDTDQALQNVRILRRLGTKVYPITLSLAGKTFADQLAVAGGTGSAPFVDSGSALERVLDNIFGALNACDCTKDSPPICKNSVGYVSCSPDNHWIRQSCNHGCFDAVRCYGPGDLLWSSTMGGEVKTVPAIANDGTIYVGADDGFMYAFAPNGNRLWSYATSGQLHSSPAIADDGTIYFGSYDGKFYAVDPSGQTKWTFDVGSKIHSSPAIDKDGKIYFGSGYYRDGHSSFFALSALGQYLWDFPTPIQGGIRSSPVIGADHTIYVGANDFIFYAFRPDGSEKWQFKTGDIIFSSHAIDQNGTIYITSGDSKLYALNAEANTEQDRLKWSYTTGGPLYSSPVIGHDGTVYVVSRDSKLYALRSSDGNLQWTLENVIGSPLIVEDGSIYIRRDDVLQAINNKGEVLWNFDPHQKSDLVDVTKLSTGFAVDQNGVVYVGASSRTTATPWNSYVVAFVGSSPLAKTSWPKPRGNMRNTGRVSP